MPITFPDSATTGIRYKHYDDLPRNFAAVTDSWEYEDAVRDFNRRTSNPPREWTIECLARSEVERAIFDDFWEDVGIDVPFFFTDKKGDTWSNVRVKSYSRSHEGHKSWRKQIVFNLIGYNSEIVDLSIPCPPTDVAVEALSSSAFEISWVDPPEGCTVDPNFVPCPPVNVTAVGVSSSAIEVSWVDPPEGCDGSLPGGGGGDDDEDYYYYL